MNNEFKNEEHIIDAIKVKENTYQTKKTGKKSRLFAKKAGVLVLSGVLLGTTAGGAFTATNYLFGGHTAASISNETETAALKTNTAALTNTSYESSASLSTDTSAVASITKNCMPSIVAITNKGVTETMTMWGNVQQESESCGSGIIVGKTDDELLIATNYHVIADSKTLTVVFSYDEKNDTPNAVESYIKGYDENKDLAVIAISTKKLSNDVLKQISVATIGNSNDLNLGEQVVAIGNALGYGQSVTTGIVSALNRQLSTNEDGSSNGNKYIQTDAAINPGNSGGALFNMKGELVGINSAKIASDEIEGMGYAIPISDVYNLLESMMNETARTDVVAKKERGYLGISGTDVTSSISSTYGMPEGVYVYSVSEGSAADKAGIQKGYILTKLDGKSISSTSSLQKLLTYYKSGEKIKVTVEVQENSEYKEKELTVTLSSADEAGISSSQSDNSSDSQASPSESYGNQGNNNGSFFGNNNDFGNSYNNQIG